MTVRDLFALVVLVALVLYGCKPKEPRALVAGPAPAAVASTSSKPTTWGNPTPSSSSAAIPSAVPTPSKKLVIYVQPLGQELPDVDVEFVHRSLRAFYDVDVRMLQRVDLPDWTRNVAKTRYRAEKLLDVLAEQLPADGDRVLGLTGVDISTTKGQYPDWGILGLATIDGTRCVISKFRTGRGTKTPLEARIRLGKVAVHEIGHTLGLEHCPTVGCLMEDARGTVMTCDREYDLCNDCRRRLSASGYTLTDGEIPWPDPI